MILLAVFLLVCTLIGALCGSALTGLLVGGCILIAASVALAP